MSRFSTNELALIQQLQSSYSNYEKSRVAYETEMLVGSSDVSKYEQRLRLRASTFMENLKAFYQLVKETLLEGEETKTRELLDEAGKTGYSSKIEKWLEEDKDFWEDRRNKALLDSFLSRSNEVSRGGAYAPGVMDVVRKHNSTVFHKTGLLLIFFALVILLAQETSIYAAFSLAGVYFLVVGGLLYLFTVK